MLPGSAVAWALLSTPLLPTPNAAPLRPVVAPERLLQVTRVPELSGLVFDESLGRYLVVSDDTGLDEEESSTAHAPFLLAMSPDGQLDEEPLRIAGLRELNDAEAICAGPGGTYFLTTSHSPNKKGNTRPARRQLLHLELHDRTLAVLGAVDLTDLKGGTLFERAGLPTDGRLDIEALAYRNGALFVGMKSPLTRAQRAVIVRIDEAAAWLRAGRVPAKAVSRWAELALCVGPSCQGISDMLFLADGSLMVAANTPKGAAPLAPGTLWHLAGPSGKPVLLEQFEGKKPEGLALSPGGNLMVVFDRDQNAPWWTERPLPPPKPTAKR